MTTLGLVQLLFLALALVMTGLGLSLRLEDFVRLRSRKREVVAAIVLQMVVLPAFAVGLVHLLRLPGLMAAGLLLLAATPGSISANLYSHVFGGNVAFNVALTGLNTLLCALTLPVVAGWALGHFAGAEQLVPAILDKALETIALVTVPVAFGMFLAAKAPRAARTLDKPVKILSALVVVVFSLVAIVKEWAALVDGFAQIGPAVLLFNVVSILVGAGAAKAIRAAPAEARTIAFQVSVHNAILAIYIAIATLNEPLLALPAALYSITMNLVAIGFGALTLRQGPSLRWKLQPEAR
jgi:BASS family bile acid:Na+ symporter